MAKNAVCDEFTTRSRVMVLDATGLSASPSGDDSERWTPAGPTAQDGGTLSASRMTQAQMDEFDRLNPGLVPSSAVIGATAGVAASFVDMAAGAAHMGSNLLMQVGDLLTGGLNHEHPMMQRVWAEQRALGQGIVNAVTSPRFTATNVIESTVNRYNNAMAEGSDFNRGYELGRLFNDVGQGAIGLGQAARGIGSLGASSLEVIGENAFTGPTAGSMPAQRGAVTADMLTGGFLTAEKLGFGKVGPTNFTEMYRTRPAYEVAALRAEFGSLKASFLREFAASPEALAKYDAGEFSRPQFENIKYGELPKDFEIHHKLPLWRGGDNSFNNFELMLKSYHRDNFDLLHNYAPGKNPFGLDTTH